MKNETCPPMETFEAEIEVLRARLFYESDREPVNHDRVDRLRAALRALGTDHAPLDPRPWSTLETITSDLWTALDPSGEAIARGVRPRCDVALLLDAVRAAHRALGEVEAVPDRLPIDTTGQFLTAVLDGLEQLRREAVEIHRGAAETAEELGELIGRDS